MTCTDPRVTDPPIFIDVSERRLTRNGDGDVTFTFAASYADELE